jgi:hypothetical protein
MIRIEGIPVVAARLADAQKAKSTQAHNKSRRTSKINAQSSVQASINSGRTRGRSRSSVLWKMANGPASTPAELAGAEVPH